MKRLRELWDDDCGAVISAELIMIVTILVIGLVTGLVCLKTAVVEELQDVSAAVGAVNQSYSYTGFSSRKECCLGSASVGSVFIDHEDGALGHQQQHRQHHHWQGKHHSPAPHFRHGPRKPQFQQKRKHPPKDKPERSKPCEDEDCPKDKHPKSSEKPCDGDDCPKGKRPQAPEIPRNDDDFPHGKPQWKKPGELRTERPEFTPPQTPTAPANPNPPLEYPELTWPEKRPVVPSVPLAERPGFYPYPGVPGQPCPPSYECPKFVDLPTDPRFPGYPPALCPGMRLPVLDDIEPCEPPVGTPFNRTAPAAPAVPAAPGIPTAPAIPTL